MAAPISRKQEDFLRAEDRRINLLSGSVRSGKTYISLIKWALYVGSMPQHYEFVMCGKTLTALNRNCLILLEQLIGSNNFRYSLSAKSGKLFGRQVWLEGANDERSENKIRGMTLGGAYCDELTLFPQGFYNMLLSRLSLPDARLIATTNPDGPTHWVKHDVIDNPEIDVRSWTFLLTDNDYLDPVYVENLKREYAGSVYYDRFILGKWTLAQGVIYQSFNPKPDKHTFTKAPAVKRVSFAVDVGHSNATAFLAIGEGFDGRAYVLDEYYHSGREKHETLSPLAYAQAFVAFKDKIMTRHSGAKYGGTYVDPSAKGFMAQLRDLGVSSIYQANNDVVDGIQTVASVIDADLLRVHTSCVRTLAEFTGYAWDEKAAARGEDAPVKDNDHAMDALRYFFHTRRRDWIGRRVTANV